MNSDAGVEPEGFERTNCSQPAQFAIVPQAEVVKKYEFS